jgi:hypothetical protein
VDTREHQWGDDLVLQIAKFGLCNRRRIVAKAGYPIIIRLDNCKPLAFVIWFQNHRRKSARGAVFFHCRINIDIGNYLSVNDQETFISEMPACVVKRSRGSKDVWLLDRVVDLHAKLRTIT